MKTALIILSFLSFSFTLFSQDKEDPKKMFRDIVNVEVDRAKFTPKPSPVTPPPEDPKAKKKKKVVEEPVEPPPDTLPPTMPAPSSEILKRAQAWYTSPSTRFVKSGGANSGKSVACHAAFIFKQKALNPEAEVDGKITMDITIEAKEGKYRYTVKNIKHKATKEGMSGGDIYSVVPEAGSMKISDRTWLLIRTEAKKGAQIVVDDIKAFMKEEVNENKDEW